MLLLPVPKRGLVHVWKQQWKRTVCNNAGNGFNKENCLKYWQSEYQKLQRSEHWHSKASCQQERQGCICTGQQESACKHPARWMDAYIKHSPVPSKISVQVYLGVCSLALLHLIGKCVCVHAWALGLQSCYSPGSRVQENLSCRAEALWKDGEQVLALGQFVLLCIASHCGHPLDMQLSSCPGVANCVGLLWGDLGGGRFLLHFGSDCSVSICPLLPTVHCPRCKSSLHQEQGKCAGFSFSKTT